MVIERNFLISQSKLLVKPCNSKNLGENRAIITERQVFLLQTAIAAAPSDFCKQGQKSCLALADCVRYLGASGLP